AKNVYAMAIRKSLLIPQAGTEWQLVFVSSTFAYLRAWRIMLLLSRALKFRRLVMAILLSRIALTSYAAISQIAGSLPNGRRSCLSETRTGGETRCRLRLS